VLLRAVLYVPGRRTRQHQNGKTYRHVSGAGQTIYIYIIMGREGGDRMGKETKGETKGREA
jgi:hypothetical protein